MEFVPLIISIISVLFVVLTFAFARGKDHDSQKENNIKMNMKLDVLCQNTNQILLKQEKQEDRLQNVEKEQVILQRDLKTAFNAIEELKERMP